MTHAIYVLQLQNNKIYVGRTLQGRLQTRFEEHRNGGGAVWTTLHRPISILATKESKDALDEDAVVIKSMRKWGVENVRGGTYSQVVLPPFQVETIKMQLLHASGACLRCGGQGHYANSCNRAMLVHPPPMNHQEEGNGSGSENDGCMCFRCGRQGHLSPACYAKCHVRTGLVLNSPPLLIPPWMQGLHYRKKGTTTTTTKPRRARGVTVLRGRGKL